MAGINKVIIVGHLGRDPEVRYTLVVRPLLTSASPLPNVEGQNHGERKKSARSGIASWLGQAWERCGEYLSKGRLVLCGRPAATRSYDDKDGVKRYSTEIIVKRCAVFWGVVDSQAVAMQSGTPPRDMAEVRHRPADDDIPF